MASGNESSAGSAEANRTFSDILTAAFERLGIPREAPYSAQDLELLHHYSVDTALTICRGQPYQHICQVVTPQLGFAHEFLMRGIFGLAALHKSREYRESEAEKAEELVNVAAKHMNLALSTFRQEIRQITDDSCQALMAFTTVLSVYIFASSRHGFNPFTNDPQSISFATWMQLLRGGIKEIRPWMDVIRYTPMGVIIPWQMEKKKDPSNPEQILRDEQLAKLEKLRTDTTSQNGFQDLPELSSQQTESIKTALKELRKVYVWVPFLNDNSPYESATLLSPSSPGSSNREDEAGNGEEHEYLARAAIMRWLHSVDDAFIEMLHERHPFTLIIVAHYAVLIYQIQQYWWMEGIPQDMLSWAAAGLEGKLDWIEWPMKELGATIEDSLIEYDDV